MQISNEVITELSALVITNNCASIVKQLDRKLYLKVNEVLEACGGKWDRKAKAHVFEADPTDLLALAISTGSVVTHKDVGFFATPTSLAKRLVEMAEIKPGMTVLEPSAGEGAIAVEIMKADAYVYCIERDPKRRLRLAACLGDLLGDLRYAAPSKTPNIGDPYALANYTIRVEQSNPDGLSDFMDYEAEEPFDATVMNPPFLKVGKGDHLDHVMHAFGMLAPGGVLVSVLPSGVEFRTDKRHIRFRMWLAEHSGELTKLPEGSFAESGTNVNTCVVKVRR